MAGGTVLPLTSELLEAPDIQLSAEEAQAVEERKKGLDALLEQEQLAKYKLEVMFSHRHTGRAPTAGLVTWWESGTKLHGGGDCKMYLCDNNIEDPSLEGRGCKKFIPDSANGLRFVVCPHCNMLWKPEQLVGEILYKLPLERWADVLLNWYIRLEMRADIYVKYGRKSIKKAQETEVEKKLRGELLNQVRSIEQRLLYIYPLRNIIRDTSAGADLRGRILAFLRA